MIFDFSQCHVGCIADAVINYSSQKVGGSGPRKTHGIYAPANMHGALLYVVCSAVRLSHAGIVSKRMNGSGWSLVERLIAHNML